MTNKPKRYTYTIFITLFIILNICNTYFLTTSTLNKYIVPFSHTFMGELTAVIANAGTLMFFVLIISLIFRSARKRMISLTILTFIINFFIFALGIFNLYYGTAFSIDTLNLFNNPTGGFAGQTAIEAFKELITYYRIVVFIPFFTLMIWTGIYFKRLKGLKFSFNYKHITTQVLAMMIILVATAMTFTRQLMSDIPIQSAVSSYAVQNYGVYPYYLREFLGLEIKIDAEQALNIETNQDALNVLVNYNKNVSSYTNFINGETYSNRLTMSQADIDYIDPAIQNGEQLHGILEDKNLVLIHLESLSYMLLQNEYTRENMSFLIDLLNESYTFTNFYTNVGMGVSSDAESAVLTGLNPQGDKTLYWDYNDIAYDLPSIVDYLNNDYYTEAIHGDYELFYNRVNVYPHLYGFDNHYSLEDFIIDGYDTSEGFVYDEVNQLKHVSPWVSDYYLADYTSSLGQSLTSPFMIYPITMMGHTPFDFGPLENSPDIYPNYASDIQDITLKYINYANYYSEIVKRFFIADGGADQTLDNTVYIFYSDHGPGLKNGDLDILYDRELSDLEERKILQRTLAFIYVPSDDEYVDYGEYLIRKGMLVGEQNRVRSEIDLYRTMIELFNIDVNDDMYFGVNGLSTEPTFALDNRVLDVVLDDYFFSLRNPIETFPLSGMINESMITYIKRYKMIGDYVLSTENKLKNLNELLNQS